MKIPEMPEMPVVGEAGEAGEWMIREQRREEAAAHGIYF